MTVRLFFEMERQIPRIRAENDLRRLAISAAVNSSESLHHVHRTLVLEQGDVFHLEHNRVVAAEPGAIGKLKALFQ